MSKKAKQALIEEMAEGADDKDPYWKLFKVKEALNTAIVEAYKLGFLRGFKKGAKSSKQKKK